MFRIQQTGPNASGQTHYLSLSGFEVYGSITGVTDDPPGILNGIYDSLILIRFGSMLREIVYPYKIFNILFVYCNIMGMRQSDLP